HVNRGLAYWEKDGDRRILFTVQSWLYAIDMATGIPISTFGEEGKVSLRSGLDAENADKFVVSTTPGTVYGDVVIMPIRVGENAGAAPGHIQAFNIISGELEWVFHTIP